MRKSKPRRKGLLTAEKQKRIVVCRTPVAKARLDEIAAAEKLAQTKQAEKDRIERETREAQVLMQLPPPNREELGKVEYLRRCCIIEAYLRRTWILTHEPDTFDSEEFRLWKLKAGLSVHPTGRTVIHL